MKLASLKIALAREAKVRPNLIYDLCEGKTKRLDLDTLNNIVNTLRAMTGNDYTLTDVLEYIPDEDNLHLLTFKEKYKKYVHFYFGRIFCIFTGF